MSIKCGRKGCSKLMYLEDKRIQIVLVNGSNKKILKSYHIECWEKLKKEFGVKK